MILRGGAPKRFRGFAATSRATRSAADLRPKGSKPKLGATGILVFGVLVFQHFQFVKVSNFAITAGLLIGLLLLMSVSNGRPNGAFVGTASLVVALAVLVAMLRPEYVDSDFYRTLALLALGLTFLGWASGVSPNSLFASARFGRAVRIGLYVIVGFACLQTLFGASGSVALYNPWGPFQYQYDYEPLLQFTSLPRSPGFYLEPSYLSFVVGSCWVMLTTGRRSPHLGDTSVAVVGLLVSRSATGLGLFVLILVLVALRTRSKTGVLGIVGLGLASGTYLSGRVSTGSEVGTSTYYRYTGPVDVLRDVLSSSPLGLPLGSVQKVVVNYDLLLGDQVGSSLDNGVYVVVFYFGWIGVLALVVALALAVRAAFALPLLLWLVPVWVCGALLFSGGILAPEYGIMMALLVLRYRAVSRELVIGPSPRGKVLSEIAPMKTATEVPFRWRLGSGNAYPRRPTG